MAEMKAKSGVKPIPFESDGLVSGWVMSSADLAEKTVSTYFDAVREVGAEIQQRFSAAIDFADGSAQSMSKLVRGMSGHMHELFESATELSENVCLGVVRTSRNLAQEVTGLASKASASLVQAREERTQRAAA